MTERKWTKFKDAIPSQNEAAFVTDWVSVWVISPSPICSWKAKITECPEYSWSSIELPDVPQEKKELHRCYSSVLCLLVCQEIDTGYLVVGQPSEECIVKNGFSVNFCPFCGYEAKNK